MSDAVSVGLTPEDILVSSGAASSDQDIVPPELKTNEIGLAPPPAPPPHLRTIFDPEGQGPREGMTFRENVRGANRTGTLFGASTAGAEPTTKSFNDLVGRPEDYETPRQRSIVEKARARNERKAAQAEDNIYEDIAYELSPTRVTAASVLGTLAGSAMSPESIGGLSSLLVRQFPKLAVRPVTTQAIDAAIVNTATDPLVQGVRIGSGQQKDYDPAQTAAAPVIGAATGGALAGIVRAPASIGEWIARQVGRGSDAPATPSERSAPEAAPTPAQAQAAAPAEQPPSPAPPVEPVTQAAPTPAPQPPPAGRVEPVVEAAPQPEVSPAPRPQNLPREVPDAIFTGSGREDQGAAYNPLGPGVPILGDARYFSFDRETAQQFGPNVEQASIGDIARNPLVITDGEQWRAITREAGWQTPNPVGRTPAEMNADIARLREIAASRGHDGLVVWWDNSSHLDTGPRGENLKLLRNVFGIPQAIGFAKPAQQQAAPTPRTDQPPQTTRQQEQQPQGDAPELGGELVPAIAPHRVATPDGKSVDVAPVVIEARDLLVSSDAGYDASLQPRQRERAASQAQIRTIAGELDPDRLGFSSEADRGAPIIGPDMMVESGNGRVLAIREAYAQGGEPAQRYRAWLERQGVNLADYSEPVLVRQRLTDLSPDERRAFAVAANQSSTLALSAPERALADARLLDAEMLGLIRNADDLGAIANRDFVRAFVGKLPQGETGSFVTAGGGLSSEGLGRVRNAVLARAYGNAAVLTRVAETTSDEAKSLSNALVSAAPLWAKLRSDVEAGRVRRDVDLTPQLLEAVSRTADLRAKGQKLDTFFAQQDAFDRVSEPVERWMRMFYDPKGRRAASAQRVSDALKFYAEEARKVSAESGLDLGLAPLSALDIQRIAAERSLSKYVGGSQTDELFRIRSSRAGADGAARGSEAQGPRLGESRGRPGGESQGGASQLERRTAGSELARVDREPDQIRQGPPVEEQGTPQPDNPQIARLEDLSRQLVAGFETTARTGRISNPQAAGIFKVKQGVVRVRRVSDFDTVAHEVGHSFHFDPANKPTIDALVTANAAELAPIGAGQGEKGDLEAFAELFRLYVVNAAYAVRKYPNATAALDGYLRSRYPEQLSLIQELRAALDALHRAPSGEAVNASNLSSPPPRFTDSFKKALASDKDPSGRNVYSAFDALYTSVVDRLHPIYKAVTSLAKIAKDNGKDVDLRPADDAYVFARLLPGAHGVADTQLKHGVIPADGIHPEGPSLADAIEAALGRKWDATAFHEFGSYLIARRAIVEYQRFFAGEIPNAPHRLSLADHQQAVAEFEAKYPSFAAGAALIYQFQQNHLRRAFEKGLLTKEFFDGAMARQDYVPFQRDMADFAEAGKPQPDNIAAKAVLRSSVMKTFRGSQRSVINPLDAIFKKVHDLEFIIARNDSIDALARLADTAGRGSGAIAERIPSNEIRAQRVDVIEALTAAGRKSGVDEADLRDLILQAEDILGDSTWVTLFRQEPIREGKEPIVYYWKDGERRALRLADGRFGREMYHALTMLSDVERNWFVTFLQAGQMVLRTGVTKSPEFIVVNFIRDQFTASATAGRRYIPFLSAARGLHDLVTSAPESKVYAGFGGLAGGAVVEAIERSGFGRHVGSLEPTTVSSVTTGGKKAVRFVAQVFEASEASTRIGLFRSYMKQAQVMGLDEYNSALYATFKAIDYIDFRKSGASMGMLRRWVPFMNAAIQGTDREFRALADLPALEAKRARGETLSTLELDRLKDARVAWIRVMTMGAVLGTGLAVMNAEDQEYQNAPKWVKDGYFLFKIDGQWFSLPKPFGVIQAIVNGFETAANYAIRKDPALISDWAATSAKGLVPPIINPIVGLAFDLPANYNRFRDRAIVPYYLQGVEPSQQFANYTSSFAKTIGAATGWSPMKIDYALTNLGGGLARDFLFATDMTMGSDRPQRQVYDWPVLRRLTRNLKRGNEAVGGFYKIVGEKNGEYELSENAYRLKIRAGQRTEAEEYLRGLPEDRKVWTIMNALGFSAQEKKLHPMYSAREHVAILSGLITQLNNNNLIKEKDLNRRDLTRSRRDADPIDLPSDLRSKLIEELQALQIITSRNAMIAVGAKGTTGLKMQSTDETLARVQMLSPDTFKEYQARLKRKKLPTFEYIDSVWPEVKRRVLTDGEDARLSDLARRSRLRTPSTAPAQPADEEGEAD